MTRIRVTIDVVLADNTMHEHLSDQTHSVGVHGCDKDGVYNMWYGSRTDLVEFEDVEVLEE